MVIWLLAIAFVIAVAVAVSSSGGQGPRQVSRERQPASSPKVRAAQDLIITDKAEEWLLGGAAQWSPALAGTWERLFRDGERYQTPSGLDRLKLTNLGVRDSDFPQLLKIAKLAWDAETDRALDEAKERHDPHEGDLDPWDDPKYLAAEGRAETRHGKFEGKIYNAVDSFEAQFHWHSLDRSERGQLRASGEGWRSFKQM